ncbi:alpha,alpha-trehalose-phosphate synthase (UDP-forming) [Polyangium jinanense]|uniref:Trehalose-6-phosphate synthase n=1 Tax=Polyangium jinanense TaxID=2829994 RepID=A0A9X4AX45_9BACT|nr:trehalose-6-phosphate synthase [Polyangium jinanense]MDC3960352.1 trehalose-6-phosphate synthase [Polyangium jinanense]MDC3987516.1 trehalose-6-phosphate synthase [Polyangium jinanense]
MKTRSPRLVIVSARAPFVRTGSGIVRAPGGLISALLPLMRRSRGTWIATGADREACDTSELPFRVRALALPSEIRSAWYAGASNGALWPLSHGFGEVCRFRAEQARAYFEVCRAAADAAAEYALPGGVVWVHDYQLALVPALLRARRPDLTIGFFWHIPWPASDSLRVLPWASELIEGVLGADLVGLHVPRYVRAFRDALDELGIAYVNDGESIVVPRGARHTRIEAWPIGVDVDGWASLGRDETVAAEAARITADLGGGRVLLSVDRMDYAKGIVERLEAFERLLEQNAEARERVTLVQIGVPSRETVPAYRELRQRIEATVGRIQGRFGGPRRKPVHLFARTFDSTELAAYYLAADAAIVTPKRDGMNLVAFEYVATRPRPNGRLLLSTTAGAADVLTEAHLVNPYDEEGLTSAIEDVALAPETASDIARMAALQARVSQLSVETWASGFLARLEQVTEERVPVRAQETRLAASARVTRAR